MLPLGYVDLHPWRFGTFAGNAEVGLTASRITPALSATVYYWARDSTSRLVNSTPLVAG